LKTLIITFSLLALIVSCSKKDNTTTSSKATYIETEEFAKLNFPFSEAVTYRNIIYLSGQVGDIPNTDKLVEGGIVAETNQTMKNIKRVLEENGSSLDKVIKCTCMLADINEWGQMSAEYIKFFPNHKPARSAFGTTGLAIGARVEIECMAYIN